MGLFTNVHLLLSQHGWLIISIIKRGMVYFIHSQASTATTLKAGKGGVISSHNLLDMWVIVHAGIKKKTCQ